MLRFLSEILKTSRSKTHDFLENKSDNTKSKFGISGKK